MEQIDAADPDRAERVTVIGIAEPKESLFRWPPDELPILERLLQGDLDRGRAGVRVKHPRQAGRRRFDELCREPNPGLVRQSEERRVRQLARLELERSIQPRMTMTVNIAPERRDTVEVALAFHVEQKAAFSARDDERFPFGHLRERMPNYTLIELTEVHAHPR